jgi:hypothetical protein
MTSADAILELWLRHSPEWVLSAYHNCPIVHRSMTKCAMAETSKEEMLWRLCGALYEQRNHFKDMATELYKYKPLSFSLPVIEKITTQLASTEDMDNDGLYQKWSDQEPDDRGDGK